MTPIGELALKPVMNYKQERETWPLHAAVPELLQALSCRCLRQFDEDGNALVQPPHSLSPTFA
jgi:hypothetical protein